MILFAPSRQMSHTLCEWLSKFKGELFSDIIEVVDEHDMKKITDRDSLKKNLIITNRMEILKLNIDNMDFIVYGAESHFFDYKKLTYICGKACVNIKQENGEVIFLSNYVSKAMEDCKDLIRDFNKRAWELGLVNI